MKRRKKSILFSATLATAGIVAGSLVAINNNSDAQSALNMSLDDVRNVLSQELKVSLASVSTSLDAKELLVEADNIDVLLNSPNVASVSNVFGNFYFVKYNTARETGVGYRSLKNEEAVENIALYYPFQVSRTTPSSSTNTNYGVGMMALDKYADSLSGKSTSLKVAVMDTGIRATHELFTESSSQDRLDTANGRSFEYATVTNNQCGGDTTAYADDNGHGTATSGLIAQSTPKGVKIIPVKTFNYNGGLSVNTFAPIVCGALYSAQVADVVNMSFGVEQKYMDEETMEAWDDLFDSLSSTYNAIFVASAGNEGLEGATTMDYPAAAPSVFAVTSVDRNNNFSSYSNHGTAADFAAPGEDMMVACHSSNTCYAEESGTSFSSPLLAAAVADILVENPSYTQAQVKDVLKMNALDLGTAGHDQYFGYGSVSFRLNKFADISFDKITPPADWISTNQTAYTAIKASSTSYNITHYSLSEGDNEAIPTSWTAVSNPSKSLNTSLPVTKNGTYTLWLKNAGSEVKRTTFTVTKFDGVQPTINTNLSASKLSDTGYRLSMAVSDDASGIAKIEWYYKLSSASDYTRSTDTYTGETSQSTKTHDLTSLAAGSYTAYAKVYDRAGNSRNSSSVNFTIEQQADTITIGDITTPTGWTKDDVTVSVAVTGSVTNITHHAILNNTNTPTSSDWVALSTPGKSFTDSITVSANGTYTIWYKNSAETAHKSFTVSNIDKVAPGAQSLATTNTTNSSVTLSVSVSDNASGVSKIDWRYKKASEGDWTVVSKNYSDNATSATTKTNTITGLDPADYMASVVVYDVAGNTKTTENIVFQITEDNQPTDLVGINYVGVPNTWGKTATIEVDIESEQSNVTHRAVMNNESEPAASDWVAVSNPGKAIKDSFTIEANGTYTVWYKNESGDTASEGFTVSKIDKTAPEIDEELDADEPVGSGIVLTVEATDSASGIAKIEWYYKLVDADTWGVETDNFGAGTMSLLQDVEPYSHAFTDLAPGDYVSYAKIFDKAGNITTTSQISFTIHGVDDGNDDPGNADDPGENTENPKTGDNIAIISSIGGAILAVGAFVVAKLRRIR